jgi:hypothetical protein
MSALHDAARNYIGMGLRVVPVLYKTKVPSGGKEWQLNSVVSVPEDIPKHFNGVEQNIGVVLGKGVADTDLDCREASVGAPYLLPATRRFGHGDRPFSHWIYWSTGLDELEPTAARKFQDSDGKCLLELRSGGGGHAAQTVFPPSTHPSGERIKWADRRTLAPIDPADLVLRCCLLAAACLLGRGFPAGGRHDLSFDIDGFLSRCQVPPELIEATVEAIGRISGQQLDFKDMRRSALAGAKADKPAGFPKIAEAVGVDVAKKIADWLAPPPLPTLRVFNPADWEGKQAPPRRWDVPDYIHHGSPALLYADGGTGKGYLGLQLAMGRALAKEWIGLMPEPGRTLVLSTEDDLDEMWRRIEGMLPFYGARMADLGDIRLVDLVGENSVLGLLNKGIVEPTPMYDALQVHGRFQARHGYSRRARGFVFRRGK